MYAEHYTINNFDWNSGNKYKPYYELMLNILKYIFFLIFWILYMTRNLPHLSQLFFQRLHSLITFNNSNRSLRNLQITNEHNKPKSCLQTNIIASWIKPSASGIPHSSWLSSFQTNPADSNERIISITPQTDQFDDMIQ